MGLLLQMYTWTAAFAGGSSLATWAEELLCQELSKQDEVLLVVDSVLLAKLSLLRQQSFGHTPENLSITRDSNNCQSTNQTYVPKEIVH